MRVLIWGTGSMSSAWAKGLNQSGLQFLLFNPTLAKATELQAHLEGAEIYQDQAFDAIVLGFKPQKLDLAAFEIKKIIKPETLIISLLAGVKLTKLQSLFSSKIIRLMPNLAIAQGRGVCLWTSTLNESDNQAWQKKFDFLGFSPRVNESELDLYTLHAGCSPAYVYALIHSLQELALRNGGDSKLAGKLAIKSLQGALSKLSGEEDFAALISQVASKGGVTEATLKYWSENNSLSEALDKGLKRIGELS